MACRFYCGAYENDLPHDWDQVLDPPTAFDQYMSDEGRRREHWIVVERVLRVASVGVDCPLDDPRYRGLDSREPPTVSISLRQMS